MNSATLVEYLFRDAPAPYLVECENLMSLNAQGLERGKDENDDALFSDGPELRRTETEGKLDRLVRRHRQWCSKPCKHFSSRCGLHLVPSVDAGQTVRPDSRINNARSGYNTGI